MQTNKNLFDLIKESYTLNPRTEFVLATEDKLRQTARKLNRKRRIKQFSFASSGIVLFVIAMSWFFFFSGKDLLTNQLYSAGEGNLSSSVNEKEPLIFIYQSHNLESFYSETNKKDPDEAFHETKNITLVGERLAQSLKKRNINAIHDQTSISGILKDRSLPYSETYSVSREPLIAALEKNKSIKMVFDIHRDSKKRSDTTIKISGKDYPRIAFIVSQSSIKYEDNLKFAERLHKKIEEKYPGLSRGVFIKSNPEKQSTYNEDLKDESVLMEIGGVENTLEEEFRTVEVFADIIEEILKQKNEY